MLRSITVVFAVMTLALIVEAAYRSLTEGPWAPRSLGEVWFAIHPDSLQLLQPAVERHLDPVLWDPYILTALTAPFFATTGIIALIFLALAAAFRPRRRRTLMD
ncbi:MAG: hypothetical protein AAF899_01250 [Pseudomonadota bacterium]